MRAHFSIFHAGTQVTSSVFSKWGAALPLMAMLPGFSLKVSSLTRTRWTQMFAVSLRLNM